MKTWPEMRLARLLKVKHGFAFKGEHFSDRGDYILLTPGNLYPKGGLKLKGEKETYYTGNFPRAYILAKGDLVVVMTDLTQDASILGGAMLIDKSDLYLHNQRLGLVSHTDEIDRLFLYCYFNWQFFRDQVKASSNGATVKHTSPGRIYQCRIFLPPVPTQRKIAAVLSAYDQLIENNKRRVALLEKLAEDIYREWFVRLRFPGYQKVKVHRGLPDGWERKSLPELADITYGFPFNGSRFNSEGRGKAIIRIRNIPDSSTTDYTEEEAKDKYIVHTGDLLIGMDGEFHINHWYGEEAYLVQRVCRLKAKNPLLEGYLAQAIRAPIKHYESILMGATVGHLGAVHLKSTFLIVPPEHLHERLQVFNEIYRQKLLLARAARILSKTRDQHLPRLISGKLSVENLDIQFPPGLAEDVIAEPGATAHA